MLHRSAFCFNGFYSFQSENQIYGRLDTVISSHKNLKEPSFNKTFEKFSANVTSNKEIHVVGLQTFSG